MLRVLTLSTLFPDASRPRFGPFVEAQTLALAARDDVELRVVAPLGVPPMPLALHPRYKGLRALSLRETWKGLDVYRPRFAHIPATGGRHDAAQLTRALLPLLKSIRDEFPFDVINASFFFPDGPAAVALGKALGIPVSIMARGSDIHVWGATPPTRAQVQQAAQDADGLLAVSAALKADMVAMGMSPEKISVQYTGVDLTRFQPVLRAEVKAALGVSGPLIVCVGNFVALKRQLLVIEALALLPGVTLALLGDGPERSALEARAARSGVRDRVRFTGSVVHEEVAKWLGAADVVAHASSSEGLANVWVEALVSGTPLVITDVGGAREVVDRPAAGHIAKPTPAAFADAIRDLLDHPKPPLDVRAAAERFTWTANHTRLYAHLSGLVAARSAAI